MKKVLLIIGQILGYLSIATMKRVLLIIGQIFGYLSIATGIVMTILILSSLL